jgi:hypothetical protein
VARGVACLIVDGPGNGESVRFRNQYLRHDTESYATAAYEWLAARPEIDPTRIGVMAISLGGYYAPRAAAFEKRFACCIAWGAQWDYWQIWKNRFDRLDAGGAPSLSVPWQHLLWIFNVDNREAAMKEAGRLSPGRRRAEDRVPLPAPPRRRRRADPALARAAMLRRGGIEEQDAQGLHSRGRRLPPLPDDNVSIGRGSTCGTGVGERAAANA